MGHAEVAFDVFLGILALLLADHHNGLIVEVSEPRNRRMVITKSTVPMDFGEFFKYFFDVIQSEGPLWMPSQLDSLPSKRGQGFFLGTLFSRMADGCFVVLHLSSLSWKMRFYYTQGKRLLATHNLSWKSWKSEVKGMILPAESRKPPRSFFSSTSN